MYKEHNAFENQIFDHYRQEAKKINDAIELLIQYNYTVIDLKNQWITKENFNKNK